MWNAAMFDQVLGDEVRSINKGSAILEPYPSLPTRMETTYSTRAASGDQKGLG
jgi:hypothetical protein